MLLGSACARRAIKITQAATNVMTDCLASLTAKSATALQMDHLAVNAGNERDNVHAFVILRDKHVMNAKMAISITPTVLGVDVIQEVSRVKNVIRLMVHVFVEKDLKAKNVIVVRSDGIDFPIVFPVIVIILVH